MTPTEDDNDVDETTEAGGPQKLPTEWDSYAADTLERHLGDAIREIVEDTVNEIFYQGNESNEPGFFELCPEGLHVMYEKMEFTISYDYIHHDVYSARKDKSSADYLKAIRAGFNKWWNERWDHEIADHQIEPSVDRS